jgi:hypothetical protein
MSTAGGLKRRADADLKCGSDKGLHSRRDEDNTTSIGAHGAGDSKTKSHHCQEPRPAVSLRTGKGLGDLVVLPPEIRLEIYRMVSSDKRFNVEAPCYWELALLNTSKLIRTELGRCKDPNHRATTFRYDVKKAGKNPDTWIREHLARISAASGQNFTFSVIDSTTNLPKLHFQLLSGETRCFELFLSMANHRQMCEHGGQMQYMWDIAARIAVAIYDRPASSLTLTSRDPNDVNITHLEAVTQSLQQFSYPMSQGCRAGPSFSSCLHEALRRRCITIPNAARLLFEKESSGQLFSDGVDAFYAKAGDGWTCDFRSLGFQGPLNDHAVHQYLRAMTLEDYRKSWNVTFGGPG